MARKEIKMTEWAKVISDGRLGPWEVKIWDEIIYRNTERPESCHRLARYINAALDSHPEIIRLREVEKAAEGMAKCWRWSIRRNSEGKAWHEYDCFVGNGLACNCGAPDFRLALDFYAKVKFSGVKP